MSEVIKQAVYTLAGEKKEEINLPPGVFGQELKARTLSEAVVALQKKKRAPIAHAKDRSAVRGGGRKPWRQKGTGRARHGSIRSPIWRGGGVTHGPSRDRKYEAKINSKVKAKTLAMVLSQKLRAGEVFVVDEIKPATGKTKDLKAKLDKLMKGRQPGSILLVAGGVGEELRRASRNLPKVTVREAKNINVLDALSAKYIVLAKDALTVLEGRLS